MSDEQKTLIIQSLETQLQGLMKKLQDMIAGQR